MNTKSKERALNDLSTLQYEALICFADLHGRNWKSKLRDCWEIGNYNGFDGDCYLQQIRNSFGPSWLYYL